MATRPDGDGRAGPGDAAGDAESDAAVAARDDDDAAGRSITGTTSERDMAGRHGWPPLAAYVRAWGPALGLHRIAACRDVVRAATCRLKLGPDVVCRPRGRPVRRRR